MFRLTAGGPTPHRGLHQPLLRALRRRRADRGRLPAPGRAGGRDHRRRRSRPCTAWSAWPPAAAAPAVQVNGEWVENARLGRPRRDPVGTLTAIGPSTGRRARARPILLRNVWKQDSASLEVYKQGGGYANLKKHLSHEARTRSSTREEVRACAAAAARASRPGRKWGFLPKDNPKPRYLCVNADESEPGTFKDRLLMEKDPHQLIEACIVSATRIGCKHCVHLHPRRVPRGHPHAGEGGARRPTRPGYVGKNILGTGVDVDIVVHARRRRLRVRRGDGAAREPGGQARPAAAEAAVPGRGGPLRLPDHRQQRGDDLLRAADPGARRRSGSPPTGTEKNGGPKLYCVSGHVARPGIYEAAMGKITLRQLIYDAGYGGGHPGRTQAQGRGPGRLLDAGADRRRDRRGHGLRQPGQGGLACWAPPAPSSWTTPCAWCGWRSKLTYFYKHESCGKCSPCREGTGWMLRLLERHRGRPRHREGPRRAVRGLRLHRRARRCARSATPPSRRRCPR